MHWLASALIWLTFSSFIHAQTSTPTASGTPMVFWGAVRSPAPAANQTNPLAAMQAAMQALNPKTGNPSGWAAGGGDTMRGDPAPGVDTDWDKYEYPNGFKYSSGQTGAVDVGNGLCTAKNANRTQVKNGYCDILKNLLMDDNTCAHREMMALIARAGPDGSGIGNLNKYCSTWSGLKLPEQKILVFEQIFAGLITRESGWKATATEGAWGGPSNFHQGRGLLQIGTWYSSKDADCAGVNDSTINDPKINLKCGLCVALKDLNKDHTMGNGVGDDGAVGMARTYGPFRDGQAPLRTAIASASNQYCEQTTGRSSGSTSGVDSQQ